MRDRIIKSVLFAHCPRGNQSYADMVYHTKFLVIKLKKSKFNHQRQAYSSIIRKEKNRLNTLYNNVVECM